MTSHVVKKKLKLKDLYNTGNAILLIKISESYDSLYLFGFFFAEQKKNPNCLRTEKSDIKHTM